MGQVPASHPSLVPGFWPDENANCPGQSSAAGARARVLLGTDRNLVPYRILPYSIRPYTIRFLDRILRYGTVYGRILGEDTVRYGRNLKMRLRSIPTN